MTSVISLGYAKSSSISYTFLISIDIVSRLNLVRSLLSSPPKWENFCLSSSRGRFPDSSVPESGCHTFQVRKSVMLRLFRPSIATQCIDYQQILKFSDDTRSPFYLQLTCFFNSSSSSLALFPPSSMIMTCVTIFVGSSRVFS